MVSVPRGRKHERKQMLSGRSTAPPNNQNFYLLLKLKVAPSITHIITHVRSQQVYIQYDTCTRSITITTQGKATGWKEREQRLDWQPWQPATRTLTQQRICSITTLHHGLILRERTASCPGNCHVCTEHSMKVREWGGGLSISGFYGTKRSS